jgi:hypothetical protein
LDEPGKLVDHLILYSQSDVPVSDRVALVFLTEAEPKQNPKAVGFKGQNRQLVTEKENLLGTRIADPWKLLEGFLSLWQRLFDNPSEITAEIAERDLGTLAQLLDALLWHDLAARDFQELIPRRHEDFLGSDAHALAQGGDRLTPLAVIRQISDVLPENQLPGIGKARRSGPSIEALKLSNDLFQ